jgi:hypothetical protein
MQSSAILRNLTIVVITGLVGLLSTTMYLGLRRPFGPGPVSKREVEECQRAIFRGEDLQRCKAIEANIAQKCRFNTLNPIGSSTMGGNGDCPAGGTGCFPLPGVGSPWKMVIVLCQRCVFSRG